MIAAQQANILHVLSDLPGLVGGVLIVLSQANGLVIQSEIQGIEMLTEFSQQLRVLT